MAIKGIFNRRTPVDKVVIARFGRYSLVRGTLQRSGRLECGYGVYIPGADAAPMTDDGIVLNYDELMQLAELLPGLVSAGKIRERTPQEEYDAAVNARNAGKKVPTQLW